MSLTERYEIRTPCFAPCADCNCRPDLLDKPGEYWVKPTPEVAEAIMTPELLTQINAPKIAKQRKWDLRFLELAKTVSTWSRDPSTKSGSVIVRQDRSIASIAFNGFPKNMPDPASMYEDREVKYSKILHSEVNAMIFAREPLHGYTLYNWPLLPCDRCFVQMAQAGITRFVAPKMTPDLESRWGESVARTRKYAEECGLELLEVDYP
jgi:dCMP deaminase